MPRLSEVSGRPSMSRLIAISPHGRADSIATAFSVESAFAAFSFEAASLTSITIPSSTEE